MVHPDIIFGRLGNRLFQGAYIYAQCKRGKIPDIFVQNHEYFDDYREEIKQLFGQDIVFLPYVALHLRVGGNPVNPYEPKYSENPFYVNLIDDGYYARAMHRFPKERFLIFSDDIEWCKKAFKDLPCDFSEGKTAEEDLKLMAGCKGIVMANSSLSWWGAYLGKHEKVIYPKHWFADGIQRVGFLKEWICV